MCAKNLLGIPVTEYTMATPIWIQACKRPRWKNFPVSCELPRAEWDFRDVPSAELKAACVWEAARESALLTTDHSILEGLPSSAAIDWLLELRGLFGATEFLSRPWMQAIGRYRQWSVLHRWLLHEVYGPLEPGGER